MTTGPMVLSLTRDMVLNRLGSALTYRQAGTDGVVRPIWYGNTVRGGDETGLYGGYDLTEPHPASVRNDEWYTRGQLICDCVGLALWAVGLRRKQEYGEGKPEWIKQTTLLDDAARKTPRWVRHIRVASDVLPGDLLASRGHVGVILHPNARGPGFHRVVDCSPRHGRRHAVGTGDAWASTCHVLRPLWQVGWDHPFVARLP